MDYLIVSDGIIVNIIVCDSDEIASAFNAVPFYNGAAIGNPYEPPPTTEERVDQLEAENKLLTEQIKASNDRSDFIEDCIAEMASIVYAE